MKILHLHDEKWDSGLTAYVLQVADLQRKAGHDVSLGLRPGGRPWEMAQKLGFSPQPVEGVGSVRRLLKSGPWDVVNAHTGHTHSWSVAARTLLSRKFFTPVVRTRGDARSLPTHPLMKWLYGRTAGVIAASEHIRNQYLENMSLPPEKVRTIYPSVPLLPPIPESESNRVGIVGRLDHVKGHTVFLEAAAIVLQERPGTQFLIAGKEAGVSVQILRNQTAQLGIEANVTFLGFVPSVQEFMTTCAVGVIASVGSEEVSRACLEWMAVGRPVVGTLVGCLPELIEPHETGLLVPPGESSPLASGILKILQDDALRQRMGHASQVLVQRKFSPEVQLTRTLDVYGALRRA